MCCSGSILFRNKIISRKIESAEVEFKSNIAHSTLMKPVLNWRRVKLNQATYKKDLIIIFSGT